MASDSAEIHRWCFSECSPLNSPVFDHYKTDQGSHLQFHSSGPILGLDVMNQDAPDMLADLLVHLSGCQHHRPCIYCIKLSQYLKLQDVSL